jgi:hypothetical protein
MALIGDVKAVCCSAKTLKKSGDKKRKDLVHSIPFQCQEAE